MGWGVGFRHPPSPFARPSHTALTMTVPGSKSASNRALPMCALADGEGELAGLLCSDDTQVFAPPQQGVKPTLGPFLLSAFKRMQKQSGLSYLTFTSFLQKFQFCQENLSLTPPPGLCSDTSS